jgi:hypothetical protein
MNNRQEKALKAPIKRLVSSCVSVTMLVAQFRGAVSWRSFVAQFRGAVSWRSFVAQFRGAVS